MSSPPIDRLDGNFSPYASYWPLNVAAAFQEDKHKHLPSPLLVSNLLISHWSKQVTWPSTESIWEGIHKGIAEEELTQQTRPGLFKPFTFARKAYLQNRPLGEEL